MHDRSRWGRDVWIAAAWLAAGGYLGQPALAIPNYIWSTGGIYQPSDGPSELASGLELEITNGGGFDLYGLTTDSGSTVLWTGGNLSFGNGAVSNAGTWNADSLTNLFLGNTESGGSFTNSGTFENTGSGSTVTVFTSGNLSFDNVSGGTISAAAGASVTFSNSTSSPGYTTFSNDSNFTGAGTITVNGATFFGAQNVAEGTNFVFGVGGNAGTGGATLNGTASWTNDPFTGSWIVASGSVLNVLNGANTVSKGFDGTGGATFTNNGTINVATTNGLYLANNASVINNGSFIATAATGLDIGGGTFTNNGLFSDNGGGTVNVDPGGAYLFVNTAGATINAAGKGDTIQFGSFTAGAATFGNGSFFTGSGSVNIGYNGATFTGTQNVADTTNLVFASGNIIGVGAVLNGTASWSGGALGGSWTVLPYSVLNQTGGSIFGAVAAGSFTNNGTLNWTTGANAGVGDGDVVTNNANFIATTAMAIVGSGSGGSFVNNGVLSLAASAGGTLTVSTGRNLTFQNNNPSGVFAANAPGEINALYANDTIEFVGSPAQVSFGNQTSFTGLGTVVIAGSGATFSGTQNVVAGTGLTFSAGVYTGSGTEGATLNGAATWTSGAFNGYWTVGVGSVLTAAAGNAKYFGGGTGNSFMNAGTIDWTTTNSIGLYGSSFLNSGSLVMSAATTLGDLGNGGGAFTNTGIFADAGGGTIYVEPDGSFTFANGIYGTINAQKAGDTLIFYGSSDLYTTFANNSYFTGSGTVEIADAGATFTGAQFVTAGTNLNFAAGNFNGVGVSGATLNGAASWTGGNFTGTWEVASGSMVTASTASAKMFAGSSGGSFTNEGTIAWNSTSPIYLSGAVTVNNNGVFNVTSDVSLQDGGGGGTFVNNGLFEKTAGTGTTSIANSGSLVFQNTATGVVEVMSGTIALGTFTNNGTLSGIGTFTGNVTNNGHVSPGDAPGTLTLTGNYVQGAGGFLDIGLGNSSQGFLKVSGTATLGGTLDITCFSTCTFSKGTELEFFSASSVTGTFTNIVQSGFTGTDDFSLVASGGGDYLVLNNSVTAAVPEPGTTALLLTGIGLIAGVSRRRTPRPTDRDLPGVGVS